MRGYILLGILAVFVCINGNAASAEHLPEDTALKILTYGLANPQYTKILDVVSNKYGFQFYSVGGCVISSELSDSIKKENDITYAILERRFGKNWKQRFDAEIDKIYHLESEVEKLVKKQRYIIAYIFLLLPYLAPACLK